MNAFDILFRDEVKDDKLNEEEGFLYTILNFSWFLGPLIAGFIMALYGIESVFIISSIFIAISLFILISLNIRLPRKKRESFDTNYLKNLKEYINEKKLYIPYVVAAGIEIWWALIYIYIPLFMINNNLPLEYIGYFLAAITVPTMLFEYLAGKISVKKGFKNLFIINYFILGLCGLIAFLITDIYLILILMVLASIPMSFIEPLQDSFFFRRVKSVDEEKFFPIFATSGDIGAFIGHISIATLLLFMPNNYAYLGIAIFMFIIAIICFSIKENKEINKIKTTSVNF